MINETEEKSNGRFYDYLKIARLDHWIKQMFIVPGTIFALFFIADISITKSACAFVLGFISTSFIASANYVINEWLDAGFDKYHPIKKNRPAVTANLKARYVFLEYSAFAIAGLIVASFISWPVFFMELWLFVMGIIYNVRPMRSKEIPYIDVLSESINNAIRLLIGWFIITSSQLPPVSIILGYWMGGAFLMATKRYAEFRMIGDQDTAALYRKSFRYYTEKSLLISAFFYALLSVFFCGVFMIKYRIELIFSIPLLCGLFCLYLKICYTEDSAAQKPEKLYKEKGLMLYVLFFIIVTAALLFVNIPSLEWFLETTLIGS